MEVIGIAAFMFAVFGIYYGKSALNQVTQLRYEHEALKKNLKELGVLKEEQEPEKK